MSQSISLSRVEAAVAHARGLLAVAKQTVDAAAAEDRALTKKDLETLFAAQNRLQELLEGKLEVASLLELLDAKEEEDLNFKNHKNRFSEALTTIKLLGDHFEIARTFRYQGWSDAGDWMSEFFGWLSLQHSSAMLQAEEAIRNHPFTKVGE